MQRALGAAQRDVEEPLLLVERVGGLGVGDRDEAPFEPGDEDRVELEALGAVEGEQLDGIVAGGVTVVVAQCGLEEREEAVDRPAPAFGGQVLTSEADEGVGVLAALLGERRGGLGEIGEVLLEHPRRRRPRVLAQVVERDLHLGSVEEAAAPSHAEGDPDSTEGLLELHRLRVDPVEHGDARPPARGVVRGAHGLGDTACLVLLVVEVLDDRERTVGTGGLRERPSAIRGPEHGGGGGDDLGRRPVVAGESYDADTRMLCAREVRGEAREVGGVGAGEAVDRLVAVTDDAEIVRVAEPRAQQPELRGAGVLELVDVQVAEAPALRCRELRVALERVGASGDEVVEVDEPALALLALVGAEDLGELVGGSGEVPAGRGGLARVAIGGDEARLGPLDLARHVGGGQRRFAPAWPPDEGHEQADLALEQRRHRPAGVLDAPPKLRERDRVEGARGDVALHAEAPEPRRAARRPPCG